MLIDLAILTIVLVNERGWTRPQEDIVIRVLIVIPEPRSAYDELTLRV